MNNQSANTSSYTRSQQDRLRWLICAGTLTLLSAFMFLWNLGASSISARSDEVIYVRIAQSIAHNGDLFPLMHGDVPAYEKPFLKLWLSALALALVGDSNWGFRIVDGFLGIAAILLTARLALTIRNSALLALLSALFLLGMPEIVIAQHSFRHATLDGLLCVLTGLGGLLSYRLSTSKEISRSAVMMIGSIWGLAVLTKSVAGLVPALCSIVAIFLAQYSKERRVDLRLLRELLPILVIPVITFIAYACSLWLCGGPKAMRVFLGIEILDRAFAGFTGHNTGSSRFYLWYLFIRGASVPRFLLMAGLLGAVINCVKRPDLRFLLAWVAIPVLLYSCAASRAPWYLIPFFPFISIISVVGCESLVRRIFHGARLEKYIAIITCCLVATLSVPSYYRAVTRNINEVISDTGRIPIDLVVSELRLSYSRFVIVEDAISSKSNPRRGRFNIEGIYREAISSDLRIVKEPEILAPIKNEVVLVRESSLGKLPPGWRLLGRLEPYNTRKWPVLALVYE